jgi:4'-phosphopantetheinyl transferase
VTTAATLRLGGGDVHVWRVRLDVPAPTVARLAASLPAEERAAGGRLAFDHLRRRFLVRRGALRRILAAYLGVPPEDVRLEQNEHGKPRLGAAFAGSGIRFSATHSEELALVAVARDRELGVDLERVRSLTTADAIADRWFARAERRHLQALPEADRLVAFYAHWTLKEAFAKARGLGLTMPPRDFQEMSPDDPGWSHAELRPGRSYVGAVVVERELIGMRPDRRTRVAAGACAARNLNPLREAVRCWPRFRRERD